jgi:hypothetical protein
MHPRALAVLLALGALAAWPSAGSLAAGSPRLLDADSTNSLVVRPQTLRYTGDGSAEIRRIHWRRWSTAGGYGLGVNYINDCVPFCARGHFHPHATSITVSRLRAGHFTRMTLRFKFNGSPVTDARFLSHSTGGAAGFYTWELRLPA